MTRTKRLMVAAFLPLALAATRLPALAQSTGDATALDARLAADRQQADALGQQISAENAKTIETADLFGPSDEEKAAAAAAAQREQAQDSNIASLNQRANDIEDQLRHLTGQLEELNHRLDEINQHIDRVKQEFDYKICALSAQQLGASAAPGDANAIPCAPGSTQVTTPAAPMAPAASTPPPAQPDAAPGPGVTHLAPPPGILGTLPQGAPMPQSQPTAAPAAAPQNQTASIDTHAQFEGAMNMLAKQQYEAASSGFRSFADANPKDALAPQALYWVGDIAYVQKDFPNAAAAFLESLKKYPTSPRAPDTMLKLGQSLIAMNQKQEGCQALQALGTRYPTASKTVLSEAAAVRKAGGCHR